MEEIRRTAEAYYENLPEEKKQHARFTFNEMDKNGDGQIDLDEYVEYLKEDNNTVLTHPSLFTALDRDGDGILDFGEAITYTSAAFNVSVLMSQLAPMIFVVIVMVEKGSLTTMMPSSGITILY
ncbi:hypothetical protein POTOM_061676 [Populus tomentosa]|uniref:EF-hand domain-containing protein n=1 Tax=Populus tomentosa TaxID=118781 RepID=A0A8X7XS49_POPTO|nr:hypothetical protein POTOM_061676 [Populus tomentosa]